MEIPARGVINRYIAAQGPLEKTCGDFWQVKRELKSSGLISHLLPSNCARFIADGLGTRGIPCYHAYYHSRERKGKVSFYIFHRYNLAMRFLTVYQAHFSRLSFPRFCRGEGKQTLISKEI